MIWLVSTLAFAAGCATGITGYAFYMGKKFHAELVALHTEVDALFHTTKVSTFAKSQSFAKG